MLRIGHRLTLIPNAESSAYGIVMELSHAEIEQLYSDASVSALYANPGLSKYRPEPVLAQLADSSYLPALCFNLVAPPAPERPIQTMQRNCGISLAGCNCLLGTSRASVDVVAALKGATGMPGLWLADRFSRILSTGLWDERKAV
jgi:hypothetical protein